MSANLAVLNTTSSHGGHMISAGGAGFSTASGNACIVGDSHSCPIGGHGVTPIVSGGSVQSTVNGHALAINGSVAGCGAALNGSFALRTQVT
jgi:uncharacterized Zn-binding protein involved in type VI secretion